ncbi:MAG TPA: GntR family transcriptional regulator [Alphaproteobacteria bacterium]|nr:GntR family transcriptional regulator [Alphaproteobacteria bacterium]
MDASFQPPAPSPLYRQVKQILVARIARGEWRPGTLLPSEPKIAAELGVSPGTVRKALDEMTADRLVERRQGRGTFVATTTTDSRLFHFFKLVDAERSRIMPDSREASRETGPATAEERRILKLEKGEHTVRIRRIRSLRGVDMMVETVILPLKRFPALAADREELPNTLYDFYEAKFGVTIRQVAELLRAVPATPEEAKILGLAAGAPVLEINREAFTFDEQPVEWRVSRLDCRNSGYLNLIV